MSRLVVTVLPLVAIASSADAQPASISDEPSLAPAVRVDAEIGAPVGAIGIVVSHPIVPRFTVEFGAGYGFSGVQASLMAKTQWGGARLRFTPGLGLSAGFPLGTRTFNRGHPRGDEEKLGRGVLMPWLDADLLAVEYRRPRGLMFAASAGLTIALRDAHWDIGDDHDDVSRWTPLPQFRLGVGKVF